MTAYDEWTGVVIEVTPQVTLPGYGPADHAAMLHALQAVMLADLKVLTIGSLTYDNEHEVNADRRHPNGSSPKRISLWEIHPVLAVYVCPKGMTCDPGSPNVNWQMLYDWRHAHPGSSRHIQTLTGCSRTAQHASGLGMDAGRGDLPFGLI